VGLGDRLFEPPAADADKVEERLASLAPQLRRLIQRAGDALTANDMQRAQQALSSAVAMAPAAVAGQVFAAIRDERFYVLTHPIFDSWIRARMEDIIHHRNPRSG